MPLRRVIAFGRLVMGLAILCGSATAQVHDGGSGEVTGTLTMQIGKETKTAELKYVYAEAIKEYGGFAVLFTDQPLPADPVERWKYSELMSAEGKLHTLKLYIKDGTVTSSIVYRPIITSPYFDAGGYLYDRSGEEFDLKTEKLKPRKDEYEELRVRVTGGRTIEGTIRSRLLKDDDGARYPDTNFLYQVRFKVTIAQESEPGAKTLPEGGGEPGKAYLAFYAAVMAVDLEKIKKAVTAEQAKTFEGANAKKRAATLKAFLLPLKQVVGSSYATFISNSGHCARVTISEDAQFVKQYWTEAKLRHTPPAPLTSFALSELPWDPQNHRPAPRGYNRVPQSAYVRLILDGGQWKIDWLLLYCEPVNLFWHLDHYQTMEDRYEAYQKHRPREEEPAESESDAEMFEIENGTPLTAGGGAAGKAYLEFCAAEKAGNKQALIKYMRGEQAALYADPALTISRGAFIWKESSSLEYVGIKVVDGTSDGSKAVLNLQAVRQGRNSTGRVLMILEDRQWKVDNEKWQTEAATKTAPRRRPR